MRANIEGVKMANPAAPPAATENVLIQAGACAVTILPQFGGKIASIRIGERELLQAPLAPILPRTQSMPFDAGDASGWDECLPSVAACSIHSETGPAHIPDHGDLWRVEWKTREPGINDKPDASSTLTGACFSLPLALERHLQLRETGTSWRLKIQYVLTNHGSASLPWSWAAHPLFAVEPGDRIVLPNSITQLRLEGSGGKRLGEGGSSLAWPFASLPDGTQVDLRIAQPVSSGIGDKLFAGPLNPTENWCALERPSANLRIRITFDTSATPYLGLWICYGGWPDRPGPKQMCVALEPATAPVDSLAVTGPWSRTIAPGESIPWPMILDIERIER
jgi:galactose mutarotase-like enzyme